MSHSDVQKYIWYKNGINDFNFSCTKTNKKLSISRNDWKSVCRWIMCFININTFQKSWNVYAFSLSIRPSVHALTLVNILQMSWNLYMLFIVDIEWTMVKMVCMGLRVRLQRHTKVFRYIKAYGGKFFKTYFNILPLM